MVKKSVIRFVAVLWLALGLLGCASMVQPGDFFSEVNEDFIRQVRWLDYQGAAEHMVDGVRKNFLERFAHNEDLRVVDFSTERIDFREDGRQVEVWYSLEWYLLPSATVKKDRFRLEWEFPEENKMFSGSWLITTEFPQLP